MVHQECAEVYFQVPMEVCQEVGLEVCLEV